MHSDLALTVVWETSCEVQLGKGLQESLTLFPPPLPYHRGRRCGGRAACAGAWTAGLWFCQKRRGSYGARGRRARPGSACAGAGPLRPCPAAAPGSAERSRGEHAACRGLGRPRRVYPKAGGSVGGPGPAEAALQTSGVSGFAFQGTNAHAVAGSSGPVSVANRAPARQLRAHRLWVASVAPHALVWRSLGRGVPGPSSVSGGGGRAILEVDLGAQALLHAHFWDHVVAGRALFPGAGFLELGCGAGRSLMGGTSGGLPASCLVGVSIPSPCLLSAPGAHVSVLRAEVSLVGADGGSFQISSGGRGGVHVAGRVSAAPEEQHVAGEGAALADLPASPGRAFFASVTIVSRWWDAGFWSPPAPVDGALHLGALSAATSRDHAPRVPAAVGAFGVRSPLLGAAAHAIAHAGRSALGVSDASGISSHRLVSSPVAGAPGPSVDLINMESKAIRRQHAVALGASAAVLSEPEPCSYELEWQVSGVWLPSRPVWPPGGRERTPSLPPFSASARLAGPGRHGVGGVCV